VGIGRSYRGRTPEVARRGNGPRRSRRRRRYIDWAAHNARRAQAVDAFYGGATAHVKKLFFTLDDDKLSAVFTAYCDQYGTSALAYAKRTYASWRGGAVNMSGEVAERLLAILPRVLSFEQKFDILRLLWVRHRSRETSTIVIGPEDDTDAIHQKVNAVIAKANTHQLPREVETRLAWLSQGDAQVAKDLLRAADDGFGRIKTELLDEEIERIRGAINDASRVRAEFVHTIELPHGHVTVKFVRPKKGFLARFFGK
jgi:hypothetical protein